MNYREEIKAIIDAAADYELPPIKRFMTRVINGVPVGKAGPLFRQEITLARAKAGAEREARP